MPLKTKEAFFKQQLTKFSFLWIKAAIKNFCRNSIQLICSKKKKKSCSFKVQCKYSW